MTYGDSKDKRPDLKQFVLSRLCVDRTVPIWGKPENGNASDKTLNTTLLSEIATILARHGVAPGADIYVGRMRPWSLRTIWRRWGIPYSSAVAQFIADCSGPKQPQS